jgi:hypothetical protein
LSTTTVAGEEREEKEESKSKENELFRRNPKAQSAKYRSFYD